MLFPNDFRQVGSEALERVAHALGARAALPQCRRLVREGLGGWTWQHQHAALSALGVLADGKRRSGRLKTQPTYTLCAWNDVNRKHGD